MPFSKGPKYNSNWSNALPKEIKKKAMKFRLNMVLILLVILILALLFSGCITRGGKKLTGVVPTGHGTYRLQSAIDREKKEAAEKKKAEEERRKALLKSIQSKPVKLPPARSKPVIPAPQSAEAVDVPIKIVPADSKTTFTPSVSEANLSPAEILVENLKNTGNGGDSTDLAVTGNPATEEKPVVKVKWGKLIEFYLGAIVILAIAYFGVKIAQRKPKKIIKKENKKRISKKSKQ